MDRQAVNFCNALRRIYYALPFREGIAGTEDEPVYVSAIDTQALLYVGDNPDCIVSDVGGHLEAVPTTVSSVVARLADRGLVLRLRNDDNRRIVNLRLTDEGEQLRRDVIETRQQACKDLLSGLAKSERTELVKLMTALAKGAEEV